MRRLFPDINFHSFVLSMSATLTLGGFALPSRAFANDSSLASRTVQYEGLSVVDGVKSDRCTLNIDYDEGDNVVRMTVYGTAKRVSRGASPSESPAASQITVGDIVNAEELTSFTTFAHMPSIRYPGYQRIGLQIKTGTFAHPWPGLQEVNYVVQKDDFTKVIARTDMYLFLRAIPLGYDEVRCEDMVQL